MTTSRLLRDQLQKKTANTGARGYRPRRAAQYLGISVWKLYDLAKSDPDFPRPIRLSSRCVIYPLEMLDGYMDIKSQQEAAL